MIMMMMPIKGNCVWMLCIRLLYPLVPSPINLYLFFLFLPKVQATPYSLVNAQQIYQ